MSGNLAKRMKRDFESIESSDFIVRKASFKLSIDNFNSLMGPYESPLFKVEEETEWIEKSKLSYIQ
jgi:hypothetical protein